MTGLPALRGVRDAFPDHHLVLAAPGWLAPLALHSGAVDEVSDTAPLGPVDHRLRRPDIAVNLHGRGPQSHRSLMATRPGRLIAVSCPGIPETTGFPHWQREHEVHRWCRMLEGFGIRTRPDLLDLPPPDLVPELARGATVVHPGASSPARRWPTERWAAVARAEARAGRTVVVTGTADERGLALAVARDAGLDGYSVLAGRTDLLALTAIVAAAGRVVSGDTGVAHLATALGTPSVVLFGPTSPDEWGPPADRPWHVALWKGRRGDPHGWQPDEGLLEISVDDVVQNLGALPTRIGRR